MKVVKKLGMAALGCLCVGISIGNINTAHAGKRIHKDPTGKAYEKVKGSLYDKKKARIANMEQAIKTRDWKKVEEYTDPARTRDYKKTFVRGEACGSLMLMDAFRCAVVSKSAKSVDILIRLLDTEVCYEEDKDPVCFAKIAKNRDVEEEEHKVTSEHLWGALRNLKEDDAVRVVQTLGKHGVKCDNVVDTEDYGKVSILDVSLLDGRTDLYKALLESGVNEFHVKGVMNVYIQKLFQLKPGDDKSYKALVGNYKPWVDEYRKTVDKQTFYSNVTGFIKTKEAEHEKKKQEELDRRKAKEQEELAKKQKEQLQKALNSDWRNAFKAGDIAKIREIIDRGYKPCYSAFGELGDISDQFLKNLVICEYKGEPHKSAEEALEFLEQLVSDKLTTWNKIFWNIGLLKPYLNEEERVEESEILCEIAKGVAKKGGKVDNVVDGMKPIGVAAVDLNPCSVRALLAAGAYNNPIHGSKGDRVRYLLKDNADYFDKRGEYHNAIKYVNILAVLEENRG